MNTGARPVRPAPLIVLMMVLTWVTGMIEAASLLALGPAFTAMQTGNVLFLAFGLAHEGNLPALASALSLVSFAVGAVFGARLEAAVEVRGQRWFVTGLVVEGTLILAAAGIGWGLDPQYGHPGARHLTATAVLAVAMGLRTVTSMRVNVPGLPTTLVTRSMTSLLAGSALGHDMALGYGTGSWARRAWAVAAMFTGGLTGALLLRAGCTVNWLLLPAAVVVFVVASVHLARPSLLTGGTR
ncbi:YoaK family protein [Streptomyces sp. Isolate_45]|uniref:YoaK family protein n=1 Tax=Streptomyces sp. Isolate_45 TaxID=2950111 RepID=UPI002481B3A0|nr:YoaK family protein [Streptomyces sp. Isolate_45]MDA5282878.1 YoaK family protein [Streptomyces sp. Isolate_45]